MLGKDVFVVKDEQHGYKYLSKNEKIFGAMFERAKKHLLSELEALRQQRTISFTANCRYKAMKKALKQFERTKCLHDALTAARIRG